MKLKLLESSKNPRNIQSQKHRERIKDYLTDAEVEQLISAAKSTRYPIRDQLLILMAWRHGLRVSELTGIELGQLNISGRELYVKRLKGSENTHHPLREDEVRLIKRYLKDRAKNKGSASNYLFLTERGEQMKPHAFNYLLGSIGRKAGFQFPVFPHILRHSAGFHIANNGRNAFDIAAYLGHKNIENSKRYVHVNSSRFKDIW